MMLKGKILKSLLIAALTCFSWQTSMGQKTFTLEDLNYGGTNFYNMRVQTRYTNWWGDELIKGDVEACYLVNKQTGKEQVLFELKDVNALLDGDKSHQVHHLMSCTFPYSNKTLAYIVTGKQHLLYDWAKKKIEWIQNKETTDVQSWNAQSLSTAYILNNNLFVSDKKGNKTQLTTDGSSDIVYGKAVHRDEFGIYKGLFWSNNGEQLAFYRMDQSMVETYPQVNVFTPIATLEPEKYPMAGRTSHKVTVGIYNASTGKTIYLAVGDPTNRYFTNIQWSPDNKILYLIELNRKQTKMQLDAYDVATGKKIKTLYTEESNKYVHPVTPITFLPWNKNQFILQSEKDGYNHLYLFNTNGELQRQITSGKWVVLDLMGFNSSKKCAYILSTECNPIQNNIFAVDIASGKRTLLDNGKGCHANTYGENNKHRLAVSESGKWIIDNYSEPQVPRNINIINTENKKTLTWFTAPNPWKGYTVPEFTSGSIKAADNQTDLYYRMVKPTNFDPNKKYPTIIYVYGGPGVRNVEARWNYSSRGWETYMAQKGYLLFILDNRGSSDRGLEFEQATFHKLGVEEMKDQMKGVDFLTSLPYVDKNRIGVHGWSFGGFMTTNLITTYPEVFKVGVAGGPVINWEWYEVMYGERYMGTPQDNKEGYNNSNLLNKAKNLKGKLQIIIGMNDPVVVPQHAENFLKSCIDAGTQPDFFIYPGEGHNMRGHSSVHLHERITQYFEDYLKPLKAKE
ncbi:DPP IV N-terminal domain-containing protein [Hoylesella nanceiensis]